MRSFMALCCVLAVSGCGSYTTPTAARFDDGTILTGTATAAVSGGTFELSQTGGSLSCHGTYNTLDVTPTITIPVTCNDGRYGTATITRTRDGLSGRGYFNTSDGKRGVVAFGNNSGSVLRNPPGYNTSSTSFPLRSDTYSGNRNSTSAMGSARSSDVRHYYLGPRGGCYYFTSGGNKQYVDRSFCR